MTNYKALAKRSIKELADKKKKKEQIVRAYIEESKAKQFRAKRRGY